MADLVDFRTKLTPRAHAVLTAVARASNRDMAEIVRDIVEQWADTRVHEATLVLRLARGEGAGVESEGRHDAAGS